MYRGSNHLRQMLDSRPTVGRLMDLCEENHARLARLVPGLRDLPEGYRGCDRSHADLHLEVIEQARFTTTLRLTHYFDAAKGREPDPDAVLRAYHDARQVEVLDLRQHILPTDFLYEAPGLLNKWRANDFLAKWLLFCLQQGHAFAPVAASRGLVPA